MTKIKVAHSYKTYEPVSMIPISGWRAVYAYQDEGRYAHSELLIALVLTRICQILVYENGKEVTSESTITIVGYVAGELSILPAEEAHNFMGYLAPGARISDHVKQRAREYILANEITKETTNESP